MTTSEPGPAEGARTFLAGGDAYDEFMGRYSRPLAGAFADSAGVAAPGRALDVGCGPGALTSELVGRLGPERVGACDPSPPFVAACRERLPGVDVRAGRAEALPYDDATYDVVLAQLVLHFVSDPALALAEMRRVGVPGGRVAACVWDFEVGMEMLRRFWDAAVATDAAAPDELHTMRFGRSGEIAEVLAEAGLEDVREETLRVESGYADFEELWAGFMHGIGPAGSYAVGLPEDRRATLRAELFDRLGSPTGGFTLGAVARSGSARIPG